MSTLAVSESTAAISLYFREGSSDKVYHAQIVPNGDNLYSVNFQYGRRGSTLQTGSKTAAPVTLAEARKIFDKLVAEKKAKGYTEGERGVPTPGGELANRRFRVHSATAQLHRRTRYARIPPSPGLVHAGEDGRRSPDRRVPCR